MDHKQVARVYKKTGSVKETASKLGLSVVTVRRILITEGLWSSPSSIAIGELFSQGISTAEIAERLHMTETNVQAYIPYTRGHYKKSDATSDAERSRSYRNRKESVCAKQVGRSRTISEVGAVQVNKADKTTQHKGSGRTLHLRLELVLANINSQDFETLKKYAKVEQGISREFLVPSTMTLHALHYAILRAFGWQNSHLHHFELPENVFQRLTGGGFAKWGKLCGVYFRFPSEDYEDIYWDDDYNGEESFNTWLNKKYVGPYTYGGKSELYMSCQRELSQFYKIWSEVNIRYPWDVVRSNPDIVKIEKVVSPKEATLDEIRGSLDFNGASELLERLTLDELLLVTNGDPLDEVSDINVAQPITTELLYEYDYGDGWQVKITLVEDSDLAQSHPEVAEDERPICVAKDGMNLLDDVGGISGYCQFLIDYYEKSELKDWARMQGWTGRQVGVKNTL